MGTKKGIFIGIDQILSLVSSTNSRKIKRYHVSVPKCIVVTVRKKKSWRFSKLNMNTALQVDILRNKCYI